MDFRVGEDQRELAEGIRAMVAGRLPLEHLRAREGDARAIERGRLGGAGRDGRVRTDPARARRHRPLHGRGRRRLRRARACPGPGPIGRAPSWRRAPVLVEGAAEGHAPVGVHCAGGGLRWSSTWRRSTRCSSSRADGAAGAAARLLAPVSTEGATRVEAPLDPLTPLWRVDAPLAGEPVPDDDGSLWRDGALLTAALQVGHAAEALDLAVAYAKERQQFGTPIGSFQAMKHMCADMLVRAEVARAARRTPPPAWPTHPTSSRPRRPWPVHPRPAGGPVRRRRQAAGRRSHAGQCPGRDSGPRRAWASPGRCRCTCTSSGLGALRPPSAPRAHAAALAAYAERPGREAPRLIGVPP